MKIYMIILDGAADRKIKILGDKTPLQVANTPALDKLAKKENYQSKKQSTFFPTLWKKEKLND